MDALAAYEERRHPEPYNRAREAGAVRPPLSRARRSWLLAGSAVSIGPHTVTPGGESAAVGEGVNQRTLAQWASARRQMEAESADGQLTARRGRVLE